MAFGRRTSRAPGWKSRWNRRRSKRKIPASAIPRSIARVRTDWVTIYNPFDVTDSQGCGYFQAVWDPEQASCVRTFGLNVMDATELTDKYGDDVKIVQTVGSLWLRPVFLSADLCDDGETAPYLKKLSSYWIQARGGLFKQRLVNLDRDPTSTGQTPHPLGTRDWSDAGFLKTFERVWVPPGEHHEQTVWNDQQFTGPVGLVARTAYITPATASGDQPAFSVPTIQTTCGDCFPDEGECLLGGVKTHFHAPSWKRINMNSRRTIRMHEDDSLEWYVDWASISLATFGEDPCAQATPTAAPCAMHINMQLKIKLQYG